ncbi:hypothetical protein CRE_12015 [Caenorhabditis remanei]|uniref:Uncharacterized protein n=1 Tax=Caenorhabditis remanei TaxID=31234 RepID=E3MPR8_CAERE|nr:hypothetical protein CRE_12015 [Caenorhabditis remanei]
MMNSRPLSYESSKSVLKHMDANKRFLLAAKYSSIRSANKATPLKIESFSCSASAFQVNDCEYRVGVYKKYLNSAETPPNVVYENGRGGFYTDFDQYGFKDYSGASILTPGDVDLREPENDELEPRQDDAQLEVYERELKEIQRKLDIIYRFGPIDKDIEEVCDPENDLYLEVTIQKFMDGEIPYQKYGKVLDEFWLARKLARDQLVIEMKMQVGILQPFYSRRDGLPVPFEKYLQFAITSESGEQYIERLQYNKKLHEALKYLMGKLFGNRRHSVNIEYFFDMYSVIIRFPVGLRLEIQRMNLSSIQEVQTSLATLLTDTVKHLSFRVMHEEDFECEILKNAETSNVYYCAVPNLVLRLTNSKAFIHTIDWTIEDFMIILFKWVELDKKMGTVYTFSVEENIRKPLFELIKWRYEGTRKSKNSFLLASRCPSIRTADRATPLNIDIFDYSENAFEVNHTEYKIGIYKKYLNGAETPRDARRDNARGGAYYDLDQYGFDDLSGENTLTPGDVDLRRPNNRGWSPINMQDDDQISEFEQQLAEFRSSLELFKCSEPTEAMKEDVDTIIKNQMAKMQPFYSRRDGLPVPFERFIQLTITSRIGESYIERLQYTKKLHEAVKYLTAKFLGNRLHPVAIGHFCGFPGIMRFPIGLRLNVKSLVVSKIQIEQEILRPLLTNTVQRVNVVVESAGDFECAMLKNAEILKVHDGGTGFIRPPMIINLINLKANIDVVNWTVEDFMKVVRNWVEVVKKKVGTSYKFTLILEENITQHLFESIKEQYDEAKEIGDLYVLCMFSAKVYKIADL